MNVFFETCDKAIEFAMSNKFFGIFEGKHHTPNSDIHLHNSCELIICLSDGSSMVIGDHIYDIKKGDVFFASQFEAHKVISEAKSEFLRTVIQFHPLFLHSVSTEKSNLSLCFGMRSKSIYHKISLSESEIKFVCNTINLMKTEAPFGDDVLKTAYIMQIMTLFNEKFLQKNSDKKYSAPKEGFLIEKCLAYINENYADDITLESIAKINYISQNQLCRLFKKHLGTTVGKYLMSKRITEAKKLLHEGENVNMVASKCGFGDYSNFIRAFKRIVGVSPGKYARESTRL